MDDLLKEAIADAKAVRDTALENAKMALEEAFTPRLTSMLSKKIQSEVEDEDEMDEIEKDEIEKDEIEKDEGSYDKDEVSYSEEEDDMDEIEKDEEEDMDEGIIEIDGVKYAPVVAEEEDEDDMDEIAKDEEEDDMEEDLDLEAVIKELEEEMDDDEDKMDEMKKDEEEKDDMDEQSTSSGIGKGTGVKQASPNDEEDPGKGKLKESEEVDEDIDLDEVLKALSEEEDEEEKMDEVAQLQSDLKEHRSVIETLRGKLNEVNLLNAKLLFTNKLFRKYGLNNEQKMKVVEQFDRAGTLREVKLVYSTLGESFGTARKEINESKGAASKPVASTKSEKKVISEGNDLRDRFKKLANIL